MRLLRLGLVVCASAAIHACGWSDTVLSPRCTNPDITFSEDEPDEPCGGEGATCPGTCIQLAPGLPGEWYGPFAVWIGPASEAAECPKGAPEPRWKRYAGLRDPSPPRACAACKCGPSMGSCRLPTTFTAHGTPQCPAPAGTSATSFNAPYMWNGSCTDANPILVDAACPPGNTPCVQSLSIAPLAIGADAKCSPTIETPALVTQTAEADPEDVLWETKALACEGDGSGTCLDGRRCSNIVAMNGWRHCVSRAGTHECAGDSAYNDKLVFYETQDMRICTPCECGTPQGDSCMSQISLYSSAGCSGVPFWSNPVPSDPGFCVVMPSGVALMSKEATEPIYTPGTCAPFGGYPTGRATATNPITVCCRLP